MIVAFFYGKSFFYKEPIWFRWINYHKSMKLWICGKKKNIGNYDCLQEKSVGSSGILCFYGKILEETMANGKIYETISF